MLQQLLQAITPRRFYETVLGRTLPAENSNGDVFVPCPFHLERAGHEDKTGSLSVSMSPDRAGMYNCFGGSCGAKGNLLKFYQEYRRVNGVTIHGRKLSGKAELRTVARELVELFQLDAEALTKALIDDQTLAKWTDTLYNSEAGKKLFTHLLEHRRLTERVIRDFRLGLNDAGRVTIPITDADGSYINVRQWLPEYARTDERLRNMKMISLPGCGTPKLFPFHALREQQIIVCEGELDALALHSLGLNAITSTGGVAHFDKSWVRFFADKDVVLMLDNDHAGLQGADELLTLLYKTARSIKSVTLPSDGDVKDVTDFVRSFEANIAGNAVRNLISNTPSFYVQDDADAQYKRVNLFQAASKELIGHSIIVPGLIAGKVQQPFAIPKRITCTCNADKPSRTCPGCPRLNGEASKQIVLPLDSDAVVKLVQSGNAKAIMKELFGVTCSVCEFTLEDYETVEEVQIIPDTDTGVNFYEYTVRNAYVVGYGLRMNNRYELHGRTVVDPQARVTHVFTRADVKDKLAGDLAPSDIVVCDDTEATVAEHLSVFQLDAHQTINDKLFDIYSQLEAHVTKIVHRLDLIQAYDLVYHSPLSFNFGPHYMPRGWMSALVIGDSQCGKSETMLRLRDHYRFGGMYSGEGITRAGIVGAYAELPGRRGVEFRLGIAPLNDGGLVVIDEAGGLTPEQFDELTSLRSTGEAVSTKFGQHNKYPARIRLIMIANPRGQGPSRRDRSMSTYHYGCLAVKELVGGDADIARFDIFVTVASDEVRYEDINAPIPITGALQYTSDKCALLLQWVWSRKASDWVFTDEAQQMILSLATEMSQIYDASIPIVAAGSQRWTIARVAAAIAARLYSTTDGRKILVTADHVEAAGKFLYQTYNKPSMGYHVYSAKERVKEQIADEVALRKMLNIYPYEIYAFLRDAGKFTTREMVDATTLGDAGIKDLLVKLKALNCLFVASGNWYTTAGWRRFIAGGTFKHRQEDEHLDDLREDVDGDHDIN